MDRENEMIADQFIYLIAAIGFGEVLMQMAGRNMLQAFFFKQPGARFGNRGSADIRTKDLKVRLQTVRAQKLQKANGDRISFLAGSATRDPNP